jgi:plastocyanin
MRSLVSLLASLALLATASPALAGDVTGVVRYTGPAPALPPLKVNKDMNVCGPTVRDQSLEVSNGFLRDVVITVKGPGAPKPAPLAAKAVLDQHLCHYVPHVQAAPVGSTLEIVNSDPMLHNIHGYHGPATAFNLAMPLKGQRIPRVLSKLGVVSVKCDVHNFMHGYVVVVDSPYAVVGEDGKYAVKGLPAGTYTVTAWHEKLGEKTAQVTVPATGDATADFAYGK